MSRVFIPISRFSALLLVFAALAGLLVGREASSQPSAEQASSAGEDALEEQGRAIVTRHRQELMDVPGVEGVLFSPLAGKILVEVVVITNEKGEKPATLPPEILAL